MSQWVKLPLKLVPFLLLCHRKHPSNIWHSSPSPLGIVNHFFVSRTFLPWWLRTIFCKISTWDDFRWYTDEHLFVLIVIYLSSFELLKIYVYNQCTGLILYYMLLFQEIKMHSSAKPISLFKFSRLVDRTVPLLSYISASQNYEWSDGFHLIPSEFGSPMLYGSWNNRTKY